LIQSSNTDPIVEKEGSCLSMECRFSADSAISRHFRRTGGRARSLALVATAVLGFLAALPDGAARAQSGPAADPQLRTPAPATGGSTTCSRGRDLYRRGEHEAARTALLECLATEGDRLDLLLPLTVIALQAGDAAQALRFSERALVVGPEEPEALYWNGRALLANNRVADARARWEKGLQLDTGHVGILEGLARLSVADGDPTRAYQFLMQLRQRGLDQAWLHRLLADIAAGKGLWTQSLAHLQDALVLEPDQAADWLSAAELAILGGNHPKAIEYGRHAVSLAPDAASLGGLGEAFFAAEQVDSALVYLRRAVAVGGGKPRVRFNYANALEVAGLVEEADQQFRLFLKEEPKDPVGHFNYAIHLQKQGQLDAALASVDTALRLDPAMLTARVVKIQVLEDMARWDDALAAVGILKSQDKSNQAELTAWEQRLAGRRDAARGAQAEGKIHLLHMVLNNRQLLDQVTAALAGGADFATLVVQHSHGTGAARGGDIGWIRPEEMMEPMRSAIQKLQPGETSPPIESKGLIHLFKRIP
jgi:tetratricopeptide (TPR) repeat protein